MSGIEWAATAFVAFTLALHTVSSLIAVWRCGRRRSSVTLAANLPPVSILRPVRGLDPLDAYTLETAFQLDYPDYELVHCADDANDPAIPVVRALIVRYPNIPARLLIGRDDRSANPKLNNLIKGWRATSREWVIMADCNVAMPPDYVQSLFAAWTPGTGLVCAPPAGSAPDGYAAALECAFLNTYQARWQYAADTAGFGFAQGKSMLWRRSVMQAGGGISALGREIAEDAAATKLVRSQGLHVRLAGPPFPQPLGRRRIKDVWNRQVRWARLRRATFPVCFLPELLAGPIAPLVAAVVAAEGLEIDGLTLGTALLAVWYGIEACLAKAAGWAVTPLVWIARDLLLPALWLQGWTGNAFTWRGHEMTVKEAARA